MNTVDLSKLLNIGKLVCTKTLLFWLGPYLLVFTGLHFEAFAVLDDMNASASVLPAGSIEALTPRSPTP